jgi:hypothetical protein
MTSFAVWGGFQTRPYICEERNNPCLYWRLLRRPRWRGLAARAVLPGTGRHGLQVRASGDTGRLCKERSNRGVVSAIATFLTMTTVGGF